MKKIVAFVFLALSSFGAVAAHADPGPAAHTYWEQEALRAQHKYKAAARYHQGTNQHEFYAYTPPDK